ncbi:hypothetical protein WK03_07665 [Burkholderia cepacia]|nr:hypothetical protein WK03_07665 [Burkholderia cepacia]
MVAAPPRRRRAEAQVAACSSDATGGVERGDESVEAVRHEPVDAVRLVPAATLPKCAAERIGTVRCGDQSADSDCVPTVYRPAADNVSTE